MKALPLAALALSLGCGVLQPPVARTVDGVTTEGRFIEPEAYALYAVGALQEARGEWANARVTYQRALELDGRGPELRTRIGAVACKLKQDKLAARAFADAAEAAKDYGPLWFELATCRRARGALAEAQVASLEAVRLDPERAEASLLAADIADQRRDSALAWRLRDALATHAPDSDRVWRALHRAAVAHADAARTLRAETELTRLARRRGEAPAPGGVPLALEALRSGDLPTAKREASLLLGADPGNGDALVLALAVADLEQDRASFDALLGRTSTAGTPVSPEVVHALAALLERRVGREAADLLGARR